MSLPQEDYLTLKELARRYRCAPGTIRSWRYRGYGPRGVLVGRRVLYPRDAVERFDREICHKPMAGVA